MEFVSEATKAIALNEALDQLGRYSASIARTRNRVYGFKNPINKAGENPHKFDHLKLSNEDIEQLSADPYYEEWLDELDSLAEMEAERQGETVWT